MASNIVNAAHNDGQNQVYTQLGVIGTLGTADTKGTALTIPIGADPATGAQYVYNLGPAGSTTVAPNLPVIAGTPADPGTVISVRLTDGTAFYTASAGGSFTNVASGTQQTLGTVGTVPGVGVVTTVTNVSNGTIQNSGTVTGVGVVSNVTNGSLAVTAGTIGGKAASGAAAAANPVQVAGTDSGGTVYSPLITTAGAGTIAGVGTIPGVGVVTTVTNVSNGTIQNSGTVTGVGVVSNITNGSLVVTAGTGIITVGTVGGKAASGAAAVANPVQIAGTDSGGTVYSPLITTAGAGTVSGVGTIPGIGVVTTITNISNGTIQNSGTTTGVGVVSNITNGSIVVTAGTGIITAGTIGGKAASGAAAVANPIQIAGTDSGGSIYSPIVTTAGILKVVDTAGTITSGTINAGTMNSGTLNAGTINAGTFTMTIGTLTAGTLNAGTINSGTINAGTLGTITNVGQLYNAGTIQQQLGGTLNLATVTMTLGTINSGTINAGTFRNDGRPSRNILSFGTTFPSAGSAFGTLVGSAAIGAGTSLWVSDISIINNGGGTVTSGVMFGSNINGSAVLAKGQFGPQGGIQKTFPLAVNAGMTNTDLNCWVAAAGTIDVVVSYFIFS